MTEREVYCLTYGTVVMALRGDRPQGEVAGEAGLTQPALSRIERGAATVNAWEHRQLAKSLGVDGAGLSRRVDAVLHRAREVVEQLTMGGVARRTSSWHEVVPDRNGIAGLIVFAAALEQL